MAGCDYYLLDDSNVTFVPKTCSDAILLWNRIRKNGINNWDDVPRIFQHCARCLNEVEHNAFAKFLCQPTSFTVAAPKDDYFSLLQNQHPNEPIPKSQEVPEDDDDEKSSARTLRSQKTPDSTESSDPVRQGNNTDSGSGSCNGSSRTGL